MKGFNTSFWSTSSIVDKSKILGFAADDKDESRADDRGCARNYPTAEKFMFVNFFVKFEITFLKSLNVWINMYVAPWHRKSCY